MKTGPPPTGARIDRWLSSARFYKTRSQAAAAIEGGKVRLNDARPKSGAQVRIGDVVRIRSGPIERTVVVRGLAGRRGTAAAAAALYEETTESLARRQEREAQLRLMPETSFRGKGRPTKRQRRDLDRLRDTWPD
ncbi:MAG TPA: RNA-binding S4 domain-containing protein [Gemmatimonadota bacterium]|nr:RNA-binding S4 domain-containing protein [Gemmatimonadota bacterium]